MLYLAEVKKQTRGLMGGNKAELKLLASQRNDQAWSPVPREELISCENVNQFGEGALVIVNLGNNQQVQGTPELAGARLVRILQTYTRLLEKSKEQEEEIEQWKQSLTYQSQELARREMEMETRIEQLEEKEQEYERIGQQRLQLEAGWGDLRSQQQSLEDKQAALQETLLFEGEQVAKMQDLLDQISSSKAASDFLREKLRQVKEAVDTQQTNFNYNWQQLEQKKVELKSIQQEVNQQGEQIQRCKNELAAQVASLEKVVREWQGKQSELAQKQEVSRLLNLHLERIDEVRTTLTQTGLVADLGDEEHKIDLVALENMPLGELQEKVHNLQQETQKLVSFVNLQEEELTLQTEEINKLQEKLSKVSDFERLSIEAEIVDAQESKKMLDETLIGQRRNMRKQQKLLGQHLRILKRRQGSFDLEVETPEINLEPILLQLGADEQKTQQEYEKLCSEIEQTQETLQKMQEMINREKQQQQGKENHLLELEKTFELSKIRLTEVMTQVSFYEQTLQPLQNNLDEIRRQIEAVENNTNLSENSNEAIIQMQDLVRELMEKLEMVSF